MYKIWKNIKERLMPVAVSGRAGVCMRVCTHTCRMHEWIFVHVHSHALWRPDVHAEYLPPLFFPFETGSLTEPGVYQLVKQAGQQVPEYLRTKFVLGVRDIN